MTNALLNGINRQALAETVDAFEEDPSLAAFTFRVRNCWTGGGETRSDVDGYFGVCEERSRMESFQILSDRPEVLVGSDRAPSAVEYLLHAMASCVTATFMHIATARSLPVTSLETQISGDIDLRGAFGLDENVRCGFSHIDVQMTARGEGPIEDIDRLCALALKCSPVFDIVAHGVAVTVMPRMESISSQPR